MELPYELADCPACGGAEDEEVASREDIQREMEALWDFHMRRLVPGTPRRFLTDRLVFSQNPPVRIGRCIDCGTLFRNPRERGRDLLELYAEEPLDAAVLRGLFDAQRVSYRVQAKRLTRYAAAPGVALEVGSYVGGFQAAGGEAGWSVVGVDLNPAAVEFAREHRFRVHQGELGDAPRDPSYDAVTIWNCFDQLPDPARTVREAREHLRSGGVLAIRVPNGAFYERWRTERAGLARAALAHNNLLGFPYRVGFTPSSLKGLLQRHGFGDVRVVGDTLVPIGDRWTRPWARWEERALKRGMGWILRGGAAPWIEVYARAGDRPDPGRGS